jgi:hypothetical protein
MSAWENFKNMDPEKFRMIQRRYFKNQEAERKRSLYEAVKAELRMVVQVCQTVYRNTDVDRDYLQEVLENWTDSENEDNE